MKIFAISFFAAFSLCSTVSMEEILQMDQLEKHTLDELVNHYEEYENYLLDELSKTILSKKEEILKGDYSSKSIISLFSSLYVINFFVMMDKLFTTDFEQSIHEAMQYCLLTFIAQTKDFLTRDKKLNEAFDTKELVKRAVSKMEYEKQKYARVALDKLHNLYLLALVNHPAFVKTYFLYGYKNTLELLNVLPMDIAQEKEEILKAIAENTWLREQNKYTKVFEKIFSNF